MANIFEISEIISDIRNTIDFLRTRNLLKNEFVCCGINCSKVMDISLKDKQIFQCNVCKKRRSIRTDSFYFSSNLCLSVHVCILFFFANGSTLTECCRYLEGKVSLKTCLQWFNFYRDVMTTYLARNPPLFNGYVHMDECYIGGKRKHHRGAMRGEERWLFGIVDSINHKCVIQFIEDKSHQSILPIIQRHVSVGCRVHSDGAAVYKCLRNLGYRHHVVVHERHLVDPVTGIHTNYIENLWSHVKQMIRKIRGSQFEMIASHLDEFMYRWNRKNQGKMFDLLIQDIATFHPV